MRNGIKRKPGRPREFDEIEALDGAIAVFRSKGYSATSLDDLSSATGLSRPSLYAAFGNKEELYLKALRQYGVRNLAAVEAILAEPGPLEKRLTRLYHAAIALYCQGPRAEGCLIVGTASAEAPAHPRIGREAHDLMNKFESAFEAAFARAVSRGEISKQPAPAIRARLAGAVIDTLAIRARLGAGPDSLKAFVKSVVPTLCA